jgi:hypothetical protein
MNWACGNGRNGPENRNAFGDEQSPDEICQGLLPERPMRILGRAPQRTQRARPGAQIAVFARSHAWNEQVPRVA